MSICSQTGENKSWLPVLAFSIDLSRKKGNEVEIILPPRNNQILSEIWDAIWFWITGDKGRKFIKAVRMRVNF